MAVAARKMIPTLKDIQEEEDEHKHVLHTSASSTISILPITPINLAAYYENPASMSSMSRSPLPSALLSTLLPSFAYTNTLLATWNHRHGNGSA